MTDPAEPMTATLELVSNDPARPGPQTTEFWLLLGRMVMYVAGLVLALVHPGFHVPPAAEQILVAIAPIAAAIDGALYGGQRRDVKRAALLGARMLTDVADELLPGATVHVNVDATGTQSANRIAKAVADRAAAIQPGSTT